MGNFNVTLSGLMQRMEEEQKMAGTLSTLADEIRSVKNGLGFRIRGREKLNQTLGRLADEVSGYHADMKKMRFVLSNIRDEYEKTERRICGYANDHPITGEDIWNAVTTLGKGYAVNALFPRTGVGWLIHEILKDEEWERESKIGEVEHTLWDEWDKKKKDNWADAHYELENGKLVKKEKEKESDKKKKTDAQKRKEALENITLWSGSLKKEGSLLHFGKDGDVETDWGSYTYSADFMKAETHMSAQLTMGGVEAEIGMSLTAFTASAAGQLGSDMLGAHGSTDVSVGKAELKGKVGVGIWDEDGNFNPKAKVKLSAEAIAAEASVTGGVDLAGIKADVTGSVNFGLGAHMDVGFEDGKLSLDLGASLGVGGSVKLDIDVSGAIEKLDDILDSASDVYSAASGFVEDAASAVGDFVEGAADAVGDFVGDAANAIGNAADKTLKGIGNAAGSAWTTVSGWFKW
ncbi:MAG: hypothetical protein NC254_08415 [bacterium]|nr:hypothetical protein [bacterium]